MASESGTGENGVHGLSLPADLREWIDERAAALEVDREDLVVEILAAHRAVAAATEGDAADPESAVADLRDQAGAIDDLAGRIDAVESEFQEKIVDVRERVVQVKRETDAKADADHTHEELERVPALADRIEAIRADLDELADAVESREDDHEALERRVEDAREKVTRVAWVVRDMREHSVESDGATGAVEQIKRAAAQEGITTATCEHCGESVHLALLTDPECPHCQTTVSDVRPERRLFRSRARLVTSPQLESGEDS